MGAFESPEPGDALVRLCPSVLGMAAGGAAPDLSPEQADETIGSKPYVGLLLVVAVVGVGVSLAAWGFLELIHQVQVGLFTDLPEGLGYDHGPPSWLYLVVLGIAGLLVALAIVRLPGEGGHVPAKGL